METTNNPSIDPIIDNLITKIRLRIKQIEQFDDQDISVIITATVKKKSNPLSINTVQIYGDPFRAIDCAAGLLNNKSMKKLFRVAIETMDRGDMELFKI